MATYTYQVQRSPDGITWANVIGASGSFDGTSPFSHDVPYLIQSADVDYYLRCVVTDSFGNVSYSGKVGPAVSAAALPPLAAGFTYNISGLSVTVTDTSTPGPSGTITTYLWDFGDGTTSNLRNPPAHTYASGGSKTITQTVTGGGSDGSDVIPHTVSVSSTPPTPSSGGTPGIGIFQAGGSLANVGTTNLNLYHIVIGDAFDNLAKVETCSGKGLVYFNATVVSGNFNTGVTYADALANGWLLRDASGNYLVNSFNAYLADVGSAGYRTKWINNILAYLAAHSDIDGIFIDEVVPDPAASAGGRYPAKYPNTSSWTTAMVGCIAAIYSDLTTHGYYVALNGGAYIKGDPTYASGTSTYNWWTLLGPHCDALMNEDYQEYNSSGVWHPRSTAQSWAGWQNLIPHIQSMGKDFIGLTYGTTAALRIYGKASFLMEWDGGDGVYAFHLGSSDPTNADWTKDMGAPSGAKVAVGVGYMRSFANGTALVNPSPTASQLFTVGGVNHTLAPVTALIL